ncbi:saccharopine dehydrogenase family protein [Phreatobacter cathodiphilus]|uniref:Saccharopine dehydrogenase n=1 Tax=Phreatobacter cathodiphilus TaxID=1868589 RepID=A0A2S0NGC8_9HYPH|nr:saccharopine dehydrogenase C-terminal domain-containing protein [Phreatobacter cathodiphilus]AVO47096.1 saccharopine dehydrogenase [Phreatobacter cathodiphilus]
MNRVAVVGGGKIGSAIALMLAESGDYRVHLADQAEPRLKAVASHPAISTATMDLQDEARLRDHLAGAAAVVSAVPFHATGAVARAARAAGIHYLDLTEDVAVTREVERLAVEASSALVPQCGLAPGFISIVAADLARGFDRLDSLRMRVGALPQFPSNALNYNLTWSTEGLINEYIEPCEAVVEGRVTLVPALEEREEFSLDGVTYEAFNTSGGLGTLAKTFEGRVRTMNYRSIRYPGHQALMKALLQDLNLRNRRDLLADILENAIPATQQDVIVIFITVCGWRQDRFVQDSFAQKIYPQTVAGQPMSAIQVTTSAGACAVLDLLLEGRIPAKGFVRQEDVPLDAFLGNRFGRFYSAAAG